MYSITEMCNLDHPDEERLTVQEAEVARSIPIT
jgi:hypothetical protein